MISLSGHSSSCFSNGRSIRYTLPGFRHSLSCIAFVVYETKPELTSNMACLHARVSEPKLMARQLDLQCMASS